MINVGTKINTDLQDSFSKLTESVKESALRSAVYSGADVIRNEAIKRAPVKTGTIKRNIIVVRAKEKSDGAKKQTYVVTVRQGKYGNEDDAFYWRFVENGHKKSKRKIKTMTWKAHRSAMDVEFGSSKVPAYPFMRPAFDSMVSQAVEKMKERFFEKIRETFK